MCVRSHLSRCRPTRDFRSLCRDTILNITHSYNQVLVPGPIGTDDIVTVIGFAGALNPPIPDSCTDILAHLLCFISAPPCNSETNLPALICEEDCQLYRQIKEAGICDVVQERIEELVLFPALETILRAFLQFDCTDPTTYFFTNVTNPDPTLCTSLFSPDSEREL